LATWLGLPEHHPDAAIELLQSLPRQDDIPWVFFNPRTGKPPVSIFYAWDTIRRRVGIPELRIHDLRHSYASFLVNAGRSLYEVQKLLGHHDPRVTMRYTHLSPQAMLEAVNVVGAMVAMATVAPARLTSGRHRAGACRAGRTGGSGWGSKTRLQRERMGLG